LSKITTIDGIEIEVDHCNGHSPCPHFDNSIWCFHPIYDKGQAKEGDSIEASYSIDNPIPKGCPLPDQCPECKEKINDNGKCDSAICQKGND